MIAVVKVIAGLSAWAAVGLSHYLYGPRPALLVCLGSIAVGVVALIDERERGRG